MKLLISDNNIIVFLSKQKKNELDFKCIDKVNLFLELIIKKLKKYINMKGYYDIKIHVDKNYGIILFFEKEQIDYFEYYDNQVDFNFKVYFEEFIYEIENISYLNDKYKFYKIDNKFYLKPKNISSLEVGQILEYSNIIFGKEALNIKRKIKARR